MSLTRANEAPHLESIPHVSDEINELDPIGRIFVIHHGLLDPGIRHVDTLVIVLPVGGDCETTEEVVPSGAGVVVPRKLSVVTTGVRRSEDGRLLHLGQEVVRHVVVELQSLPCPGETE